MRSMSGAVVGLAMGWMRTEAVMESFRQGLHTREQLEQTDSVEFGGRAVLALASDPSCSVGTSLLGQQDGYPSYIACPAKSVRLS